VIKGQNQGTETDRVLERLRSIPEPELQTDVVIPLLKNQGAKCVECVHGPTEKGKDIVYVHEDFDGDDRLVVCQVKNQPFSGRAGDDHAISVLSQLIQCRAYEVRNPITNLMQRPQGVVLLSTYDLPQKDLAAAGRLLQEMKEKECKFVGPEELVKKVKRYLPEVYADFAYPGGGLYRLIRRYVNTHHEAAAFDLQPSDERSLADFYINLGLTQTGQLLDGLARGDVVPHSPRSVRLGKKAYLNLSAQYELLAPSLGSLDLFELQPLTTKATRIAPENQDMPQVTSEVPPPSKGGNKDLVHVTLKQIHFAEFIKRALACIKTSLAASGTGANPDVDIATKIRFIVGCGKLVETLIPALEGDAALTKVGKAHGLKFEIDAAPATSLLALDENLCVLGEAGAGKTSLARELARVALDRKEPCLFFPCSRLDTTGKTLREGIIEFLRTLGGPETSLISLIEKVKWIIIDGCDEAATAPMRLSSEIAKLALPKPVEEPVLDPLGHEPDIPSDLQTRIRYNGKTKVLVQEKPIASADFERLLILNKGSHFADPLRRLMRRAKSDSPRVIVTTREPVRLEALDWFVRVRLSPFTDDQLDDFFKRWCSGGARGYEPVLSFLKHHPKIREICRTPIVATLVAALYQNGYSLPLTKTDVYAKRFDLLIDRWDRVKGVAIRNRIVSRDKMTFLQRLALHLHEKHKRLFGKKLLTSLWKAGFANHYPTVRIDDLVWELRSCNSLIFPEGKDTYSLGHLSYQEFLAARAIAFGQKMKLLQESFSVPRWRQVLVFYAGITGDISKLLQLVQRTIPLSDRGLLQELMDEARDTPGDIRQFVEDIIIGEDRDDDIGEEPDDGH
jgi:NACHT domain